MAVKVSIRRDRGKIAHFKGDITGLDGSCQQQGQGRRIVRGITRNEAISSRAAIATYPSFYIHQLSSSLGFPAMLLLPSKLYPHCPPHCLQVAGVSVLMAWPTCLKQLRL